MSSIFLAFTMKIELVIFIAVGLGAGIYTWVRGYRPSRQYVMAREPDPDRWQQLYQGTDLAAAKEALATITKRFLLRDDDAARLLPEDKLIDIYNAAYPKSWLSVDACEFEMLWGDLKESLGASEEELQNLVNMTVQDVIDMWLRKSRREPDK